MYAFCTGSRMYKTEKLSSDIDLVIYTHDAKSIRLLLETDTMGQLDQDTVDVYGVTSFSLKHGKLNVILLTTLHGWLAWRTATRVRLALGSKYTSRRLSVNLFQKILTLSWPKLLIYWIAPNVVAQRYTTISAS